MDGILPSEVNVARLLEASLVVIDDWAEHWILRPHAVPDGHRLRTVYLPLLQAYGRVIEDNTQDGFTIGILQASHDTPNL